MNENVNKKKNDRNIFIQKKQAEFNVLKNKFERLVDPIERYIKRQEMLEIRTILQEFGVEVEIP